MQHSFTGLLVGLLAGGWAAAVLATPAPQTLPLYSVPPSGWEHTGRAEITEGWPPDNHRMLRNVTAPTLAAYLPDADKATGVGVLVIPGGGFAALSIDQEGTEVARWLADRGIAAFVLKYRVEATDPDRSAFFAAFMKKLTGGGDPKAAIPGEAEATADGRAALMRIQQDAAHYGLDRQRIGVLGFSAGGFMALSLGVDPALHPAFVGDLYAPVRPGVVVPARAPPLFSAVAADDPLFGKVTTASFDAWRAAHAPAELHVYAKGGHGFGTRKQGTTSDGWLDDFYRWLGTIGMTQKASAASH
jgi:acetyl esterase/lipase